MSIVNVQALKQNGCQLWWPGQVASSNAPKAITTNGDCKQILPFSGAGIGMFTNSDSRYDHTSGLQVTPISDEFLFGTGDFTVESYVYVKSSALINYGICGCPVHPDVGTPTGWMFEIGGVYNNFELSFFMNGYTNRLVTAQGIVTQNVWHHVAAVRLSGILTIYLDGVSVASESRTQNVTASANKLGVGEYGPSWGVSPSYYCLNGYISDLKISKGVARYTSNFTPPRRQLESDSNTKLLLHFNRNDSTFIDSSPSAHTITAYGNAKQLCSPVGSGVAYFDGNGDYLTVNGISAIYSVDGVDFCHEFYVYLSQINMRHVIYSYDLAGNCDDIYIEIGSNNQVYWGIRKHDNSAATCNSATPLSINTWYHVACIRQSGVFKLYINGQLDTTGMTWAGAIRDIYSSSLVNIGKYYSYCLNGFLSEVRSSIGTCRYIASFTPPTQPFKPDPYTKFLLHMDGQGNAFYDSSDPLGDNGFPILPDGVTVTPSGTFTTQKMKDGRNVWKFDGSTNYITISDHAAWSMFLNDFTIAAWVKFDSIAANRIIIGQYTDANNQWYVRWTTSNVIELYGITSSTARFNFSCPLTPVAGTWYHVVVQRSGSSCIMYINGVAQIVTQTTAFSATATDIAAVLSIGKINTEYQAGNTKDLQIFHKALTMDQVSALYQETYIY